MFFQYALWFLAIKEEYIEIHNIKDGYAIIVIEKKRRKKGRKKRKEKYKTQYKIEVLARLGNARELKSYHKS